MQGERISFTGSAEQFVAFVRATGMGAVPWGALAAMVTDHGLSLSRGTDGLIHMDFDALTDAKEIPA